MSMKNLFRAIPGKILDAFGDVPERVTYERVTRGPVDPVAGRAETVTQKVVRGVFMTDTQQRETVDQVKGPAGFVGGGGQTKLVVSGSELGFEPEIQDVVVRGTERYVVTGYVTDPVGAAYQIRLRPS